MPWQESSVMEQREEFVRLALVSGANVSELCRRFGIDPSNGHKWLNRYKAEGRAGLADRSRRPHPSPLQTDGVTEAEVLRIRAKSNNAWGGRKIARVMEDMAGRKYLRPPRSPRSCADTASLKNTSPSIPGRFSASSAQSPTSCGRWTSRGILRWRADAAIRSPFSTITRDIRSASWLARTSRTQRFATRLTALFRRYGLPFAMLMDNGSPWGDSGGGPLHSSDLADAPWHPRQPWPSLSSADARQR